MAFAAVSPHVLAADAGAVNTSQRIAFDIAAGPLEQVLPQFAAASGVTISAPPELVKGVQSSPVRGAFSVQQGLQQLLDGTELQAVLHGKSGYVLSRAVAASQSADEATLPAVTVSTGLATTEGTGSYTTPSMNTATRLSLSPRETPQSISVMTRQRMDDLGIQSVEDIANNTTGVSVNSAVTERQSFYARGFSISNFALNGLPISSNPDVLGFNTLAMYDRVEVLRGAAGLLTGTGNPSGVLNMVRKRPTNETQVSLTGSVGRWQNYRGELDAGGALNEAGTLRGRAVVAYQDSDTFIRNYEHQRTLVYGTLEADLTRDTTLSIGASYNKEDNPGSSWFGQIPYYADGRPVPLPRSGSTTADWDYWNKGNAHIFAELEHGFGNGWRGKLALNYFESKLDSLLSSYSRIDDDTFLLEASAFPYDHKQYSLDANINGPFELFGRKHELVLGANYLKRNNRNEYRYPVFYEYLFNPLTWDTADAPMPTDIRLTGGSTDKTEQSSVYATTRLSLADPLMAILGVRFDRHETQSFSLPSGVAGVRRVNQKTTPYAGLVYDFDAHHSMYASAATIFNPQTAKDKYDKLLDPVTGTNLEAGIKGEYLNGALNVSAAVFRITQKNLARGLEPSECNGLPACSEAAGEIQSDGFEMEATGAITPDWNISAGYSYASAKYTQSTNANTPVGSPYNAGVPKRLLRLSSSYRLSGDLNQWRVGGSLQSQSKMVSTNTSTGITRITGGRTLANLMVGWAATKQLDLRLHLNNVFDKSYYAGFGGWGEPRNIQLTAKYTFR